MIDNAYLTILLVERIGNALKVTGAKKMFANLMVIPAREIQTVLSINYVLMEIVIGHLLLKYIAIVRCNVLQSMSVLDINALNVDMQADLKDPLREVDHLVNQIVILTLIAMKMNHARMAIVYSAIVIQDKHACTVCAKLKWRVTERKNALMDQMFVSVKNVTKFVRVERCVLKDISVDLMFVYQTTPAIMTKLTQDTARKDVINLAFGVTQL